MAAAGNGGERTPYRVKLHQMETCNCNHGCNCQFVGIPTEGKCEFVIGWEAIEGSFGGVDLGGLRFVAGCKYPGAIHEGNGSAVLFVDEGAPQEQVDGIVGVMSGRHGGMPWEALAGTLTSFTGPIRAPIEMEVAGRRSSYRVPGLVEVRMSSLKDVVSGQEKEVHIVYPKGGFFWNDGDIATTDAMRITHDAMRFEHPGRYAAYAIANWTNQG
jgi:hypothetical protein